MRKIVPRLQKMAKYMGTMFGWKYYRGRAQWNQTEEFSEEPHTSPVFHPILTLFGIEFEETCWDKICVSLSYLCVGENCASIRVRSRKLWPKYQQRAQQNWFQKQNRFHFGNRFHLVSALLQTGFFTRIAQFPTRTQSERLGLLSQRPYTLEDAIFSMDLK